MNKNYHWSSAYAHACKSRGAVMLLSVKCVYVNIWIFSPQNAMYNNIDKLLIVGGLQPPSPPPPLVYTLAG